MTDTVLEVIERLVTADVNRLVIVDSEDMVEGIVTVSDMIDFLVLRNSDHSSPVPRNTRARSRSMSVSENCDNTVNDTSEVGDNGALDTSDNGVSDNVSPTKSVKSGTIENSSPLSANSSINISGLNDSSSGESEIATTEIEIIKAVSATKEMKFIEDNLENVDISEDVVDSVGESGHSSSSGDIIEDKDDENKADGEDETDSPPKWFRVIKD